MQEVHVALSAEKLFSIGPFPVTNSLVTTWIVTLLLIAFAFFATRKIQAVPGFLQNIAESMVEVFQDLVSSVAGEKTRVFLPIITTFFFFIIVGNYFGLLPGVGSVGFFLPADASHQAMQAGETHEGQKTFVPFFRSINSDLNTTLALALVSVFATHYLSIRYLGLGGYLGKFFSLNPIFLFVGLLEIVSEITKLFSLSFRLFGNVFAGEVLLTTASTKLFAIIVPIPFYFLELLVGFVQALIFAMLTLVFMVILTQKETH